MNPKPIKTRLNMPVPQQIATATKRAALRANMHVNEYVEKLLRDAFTEMGIDLTVSLDDLQDQLDRLGYPPAEAEDDQTNPTKARHKRAA
jgi:hypothetical protein